MLTLHSYLLDMSAAPWRLMTFQTVISCAATLPTLSETMEHRCNAQSLAFGALKAWTLPLSTPAIGSMVTLIRAGRRAAKAFLHVHASSADVRLPTAPCVRYLGPKHGYIDDFALCYRSTVTGVLEPSHRPHYGSGCGSILRICLSMSPAGCRQGGRTVGSVRVPAERIHQQLVPAVLRGSLRRTLAQQPETC